MQVLVAGATGAVGSRLVPLLVQAGHSVVGLTRTPAHAPALKRAGATAVIADALDPVAVRNAVLAARPEVVVHEVTALRGMADLRKFDRAFSATNRHRTQGLDTLMAAALAAGSRRFVAQSYCGWPYAPIGGPVKDEDDPLDPAPPRPLRRALDAIAHLEHATTHSAMEGVVLRYGTFYGPDTGLTSEAALDQVRQRRFPLVGSGEGWWSFVHVDDAAAATVRAVEHGAPGLYNIVDDEPAPVREWLPALAALLGAKPPRHVPAWLARWVAGDHVVHMMTTARAGSNAKARRELQWRPVHASWRDGFASVLARQRAPGRGLAPAVDSR